MRFHWRSILIAGTIGFLSGISLGAVLTVKTVTNTLGHIAKHGALELAEKNPKSFVKIVGELEKEHGNIIASFL